MIDVAKHTLDTAAAEEEIARINEDNEWQKRLRDLAGLKKELKKKHRPPSSGKAKLRQSAHQQAAITRR